MLNLHRKDTAKDGPVVHKARETEGGSLKKKKQIGKEGEEKPGGC